MSTHQTVKVAVLGASGYTGGELLRLLAAHPRMEVTVVTAEKSVGATLSSTFPYLASVLPPLTLEPVEIDSIATRVDAVFLALPHTKSLSAVAAFVRAGKYVVDLSADYRLRNPADYERWYDTAHSHPDLLEGCRVWSARTLSAGYPKDATRRITGLLSDRGHSPIGAFGCAWPDPVPSSIVIDAKSGVSGAGRSPALAYHFPEAHESLEAYKIGQHRHIPEIEQELRLLGSRHTDSWTHTTWRESSRDVYPASRADEPWHSEYRLLPTTAPR